MKNLQNLKNLLLAILFIFAGSCEINENNHNDHSLQIEADQSILKFSTIVKLVDGSGDNSIKVQFQSDNELLIRALKESLLELVALKIGDTFLENDLEVINNQSTNQDQTMDHLRITVLQQNIQPDVIAYSIKRNQESILMESRRSLRLIQSEFISAYASIGGYIQAYFNASQSKKNFHVMVENREDPSNSPAITILKGKPNDPLLVTGFADPSGIARLWRVRIIHESGIFPLVFWTGSLGL